MFTLLFAFEAILVNKKDSENATEREVIKETFVSIMSACILSLVATILSIIIVYVGIDWLIKIITVVILALSFIMIMLLLLIIKRTFKVYIRSD
jgi:Mg/Co/Ni transporter MgtE